jgi:hypothetical protein
MDYGGKWMQVEQQEGQQEGQGVVHSAVTWLYPMRMKVVSVETRNESESDYETAVELSHWSLSEQTTILETATGVRLCIKGAHQSVTHSYLEPDFDLFEKGGDVVYLNHSDNSNDRNSSFFSIEIILPKMIPEISKNDFADLARARGKNFNELLSNTQENFLYITEWGDDTESSMVRLGDEALAVAREIDVHPKWKGRQIMVPMRPELIKKLREADIEMLKICQANWLARIHNSCEFAKFESSEETSTALLALKDEQT